MEKVYDFIVVGSGFGGSIASLRLSEKGYSVLTNEKGRRFIPEDFPKSNWNLRKYLCMPWLGFYDLQKLTFNRKAIILSGVGAGGGSLVYANTLFYPPDNFFVHDSWKQYGNWKVSLKPFYDRASHMMGRTFYQKVNPEDRNLWEVAKDMNRSDTFKQVHVGVYLNEKDEERDPYFNGEGPLRKPCIACAGCMVGCRENTHVEVIKYPDGSNALKWFFAFSAPGNVSNLRRTLRMMYTSLCHPMRFLKVICNRKWSTNLVIFLVMQHVENAMRMVWRKGLWGGKMALDNAGQKRVPAYIEIGQKEMEAYARKTNRTAQNMILEVLFDRPTTAHILGGCPMSESVGDGVINPDLSVHGYPGMCIVDGSIIQGNLGMNPSFTILAMAEYAMSKIPEKKDQHKKQEVQIWQNSC